ncbi:MAG: DNA methylase [Muribaculaceae bacterium]
MDVGKRCYIAIDLKSFYASVECVERGLDPLDTNLVVADAGRTDKTICLAVSPPLKRLGTGGRPRMFEVRRCVADANRRRLADAHGHSFSGSSVSCAELSENSSLELDFIVAKPRMAHYIEFSTRIYDIYLRFVAPEDMHVYSIDEVFIDATSYLPAYSMSAHDFARLIIRTVLRETGVTATAGIGTNLYLCKVAMDIVAKKMPPDTDGVRIAELDESDYRRQLWNHRPLTDFWRVGCGTAARLERSGIMTMGDVARCSLNHENILYKMFGVNAELLIDHAWGWEPVTMELIKAYRPESRSICSGQVLSRPYSSEEARTVVLEMADELALDLVSKRMLTDKIVLELGYDVDNLSSPKAREAYTGRIHIDRYGREVPEHAHGTITAAPGGVPTSSSAEICSSVAALFDRIVNPALLVRRLTLTAIDLQGENEALKPDGGDRAVQLDLFGEVEARRRENLSRAEALARERRLQEAILKIKGVFGKNAILKGINYAVGATQRQRNKRIGGHSE